LMCLSIRALSLYHVSFSLYRPLFSFYCSGHHRDLHSFPTRRSSDLKLALGDHAEVLCTLDSRDRALHFLHRGDRFLRRGEGSEEDRKSTRLNSSHDQISYAVFCLKKKKKYNTYRHLNTQH